MTWLQFKGRVFVENHHLAVPFHEMQPVRSKDLSRKASLHDNPIVEGDNPAALKALLPTYHGKVKCIYIDPPYNTGNEGWACNDNVFFVDEKLTEYMKEPKNRLREYHGKEPEGDRAVGEVQDTRVDRGLTWEH